MKKVSGNISKTMLFNVVYGLLALSVILLDFVGYGDFVPDPNVVALLSGVIIPAVNLILRKYFTSEAVA